MKASELRIGNFFLLNGQVAEVGWATIMEIDRKEKGLLVTYHGLPPKHEPIPLTEEWLIKFGFEEMDSDIPTWWRLGWIINKDASGNWFTVKGEKVIINYIHQLQNLYFALTGDELTVKES